mgnify:CR=1 FL=1
MNGHFIEFHSQVQKLEWITPNISTLQGKPQNEQSFSQVVLIDFKIATNKASYMDPFFIRFKLGQLGWQETSYFSRGHEYKLKSGRI